MKTTTLSPNQLAALWGVFHTATCPMAHRTRNSLRALGLIEPLREAVGVNRGTWLGEMLTPAGREVVRRIEAATDARIAQLAARREARNAAATEQLAMCDKS